MKLNNEYLKYIYSLNENKEEAIQRLKKYLVVDTDYNPFDYFQDILIDFINNKKLSIDEINCLGGRFGRKTYEVALNFCAKLLALAIKENKKVVIYGFRLFGGADIKELKKVIRYSLENIGLIESSNNKNIQKGTHYKVVGNIFEFIGGSFIQLAGVFKSNGAVINNKGLANCNGFDLAIDWEEEANEIGNSEFQAIRSAIRGAKQRLSIATSNPDSEEQDFVKYCLKHLKQNKNILELKGEQFYKYIDPETEKRKIFHYTNYKINPYLSLAEVQEMLELKKNDDRKYQIWGLGQAGNLDTSIFDRYLFDKAIDFIPKYFTAGIDLGQADTPTGHPTRAILIGMNENITKAGVLSGYKHSNATMGHKNSEQVAIDICYFFQLQAERYQDIKWNNLIVKVDYGAGGLYMIDTLNKIANSIKDKKTGFPISDWLKFIPVDKSIWFLKDRIDITITLLSLNKLIINKNNDPDLWSEMKQIQWIKPTKTQKNYKLTMLDKFDDGWDALMYGLMEYIPRLMSDIGEQSIYKKQLNNILNERGKINEI